MKVGIVGLPGSGTSTLFTAMTRNGHRASARDENAMAAVSVPDPRVDWLSNLYHPRKTTYAQVEYLLPGGLDGKPDQKLEGLWNQVRNCDSLIHVVRNFNGNGAGGPFPDRDLKTLDREMVFADFMLVEKRRERIEADRKRGKKVNETEAGLMAACASVLEKDQPLRLRPEIAGDPILKGFGLLSTKPTLVLFNNPDDDESIPALPASDSFADFMAVKGKIESELAHMSPEDAREFMEEYGIQESAMNRIIQRSYRLLGLISFFTVGEDEVKAWTIKGGTMAVDAAEAIHSDIKKGFIRAEVLAYDDLVEAKTFAEAKKKAKVRNSRASPTWCKTATLSTSGSMSKRSPRNHPLES